MKKKLLVIYTVAAVVAASLGGAGIASAGEGTGAKPSQRAPAKLVFNARGEAELPRGYRSWVHTFSGWEPITTTILDGTMTKTPEFKNLYVEPVAYRAFMETGKWPEGTMMVKEFTATSVDKKKCDGPPAYICNVWYGKAIFQTSAIGIGVMLKDSKRFPKEPGGWAYFSFGHQPPPYQRVSPLRDRAQCAQCHIDRAGPKQDFVFSINQPGLSREGRDKQNNLAAAFADSFKED